MLACLLYTHANHSKSAQPYANHAPAEADCRHFYVLLHHRASRGCIRTEIAVVGCAIAIAQYRYEGEDVVVSSQRTSAQAPQLQAHTLTICAIERAPCHLVFASGTSGSPLLAGWQDPRSPFESKSHTE